MSNIGVLMVSGVYYPEVNGAANQCRQLVKSLRRKIYFSVLTTTRNPSSQLQFQVDKTDVYRVSINGRGIINYCEAIIKMASFFLFQRKNFQIVHLHGFSRKSVLLIALSKIFGKKVILKMTSVGHDDPISIGQRSFFLNYFFSRVDGYVGISPRFKMLYRESQLPSDRLIQIPNGVDTKQFCLVKDSERERLRDELGLPDKMKMILFVGHFSKEKCPNLLLEAWKLCVFNKFPDTGLIFIGSTNPNHYEVDSGLVKDIQLLADPYIDKHIFFIESAQEIEKYFKSSDIFVLPSIREGMPNVLLEAMACGLPIIVSKLKGVTDWVINDGMNGLLVDPGVWDELGRAIKRILNDNVLAESLGKEARKTVLDGFSVERVSAECLKLYHRLIPSA